MGGRNLARVVRDGLARQMRIIHHMKPNRKNIWLPLFIVAVSLIAVAFARPACARVDVGINIGVPPPPPPVVFQSPPDVVVIPRTQVFYVPSATDYDMYRYGPYWYINRDGYWYRSRAYGGPFNVVAYDRLPHAIVVVPTGYRHHPPHPHGGPPGHFKHYPHGHGHGHRD